MLRCNANVSRVVTSPIVESLSWVEGRSFPPERPLLDVSQAAPDYPPAVTLREHLAAAVLEPALHRYTPVPGRSELRSALAAATRTIYGGAVTSDEVVITAGCNQAFCLVMTALAGPGDEVVLPLPYYFNHDMWLRMQGIRPVYLEPEADMVPSVERAAALLSERTRALVLVTPNNPTGAVYSADTLDRFYDLAERHGLALVVDETYRDFLPPGQPPHRLFLRDSWRETLVHLYSFSKVLALPGARVGAVIASPELLVEVCKAADCVAICTPNLGQEAALFGLRQLGAWRDEKRALMAARLDRFRSLLAERDTGYEIVASGAYFAYVRHPFGSQPARAVARTLVEKQHLLCLAGEMFGPGQEAYLRLAFANLDESQLPELVVRLATSH